MYHQAPWSNYEPFLLTQERCVLNLNVDFITTRVINDCKILHMTFCSKWRFRCERRYELPSRQPSSHHFDELEPRKISFIWQPIPLSSSFIIQADQYTINNYNWFLRWACYIRERSRQWWTYIEFTLNWDISMTRSRSLWSWKILSSNILKTK